MLFGTISYNGHATEEQTQAVVSQLEKHASHEFRNCFQQSEQKQKFVFHLSRICILLEQQIREEVERNLENNVINVTLISHGNISMPFIPSQLHLLSLRVPTVTLYAPWGCAINAGVVYGIATGNIDPSRMIYSCPDSEILPSRRNSWNDLSEITGQIPSVHLAPLAIGEGALHELQILCNALAFETKGLVIPYFTGNEGTNLGFPEVPLWVVCCAIGLLCAISQKYCRIHVACCLSVSGDFNIGLVDPETNHVRQTVYCTVPVKDPPHVMRNGTEILWQHMHRFQALLEPFL